MQVGHKLPNRPTNSPSKLTPETLVKLDDAFDDSVAQDSLASDAASPLLLRRRLESNRSSPICESGTVSTTSLSEVWTASSPSPAQFGNAADEFARLKFRSNHLLAESRDKDHLAEVFGIGQTTEHHSRSITQLIGKALSGTLQAGPIHAIEPLHQELA